MLEIIKNLFKSSEQDIKLSKVKTLDNPCPNCRGILYSELIDTLEYGWTEHVWCSRCSFVANLESKIIGIDIS